MKLHTFYIDLMENGNMCQYDPSCDIEITKSEWWFLNEPNKKHKLKFELIYYTDDIHIKLNNHNVYRLQKLSNNGGEICIVLSFWQNIKFNMINGIYLQKFLNNILKILKPTWKILKWVVMTGIAALIAAIIKNFIN